MSEQFYDDNKENKNTEYHFTGEQLNQVSQDAASQSTASGNSAGQSGTARGETTQSYTGSAQNSTYYGAYPAAIQRRQRSR